MQTLTPTALEAAYDDAPSLGDCQDCGGTGEVDDFRGPGVCAHCDGTGCEDGE